MMFESGAGVEVLENKHYMAVRVYLPWEFIVRRTIVTLVSNLKHFFLESNKRFVR